MKIEKITEKLDLNVSAQSSSGNDCMKDCYVWKHDSAYLYSQLGKWSGCYQGYAPRWSTWW